MYQSTITERLLAEYNIPENPTNMIMGEIENAYWAGKQAGIKEEKNRANGIYACEKCGRVTAFLYPDQTCAACWEKEGKEAYQAELDESNEYEAGRDTERKPRPSFSDEVNAKRAQNRKRKAKKGAVA